VALLDFQFEARFNHSLSNLAYASHIASRIAYHVCIMLFEHCMWLIVFLLLVCLVWVEPGDEFVNEEPVEFAYEDQVNSDNFAGKMIIPSKSCLSLLARCSLFCYAYATMPTTCLSCLPNCHVKPLTHHVLANRWLAMLPLCSAPLIALLVASEDWRSFLVGTLFIVGISLYYLVILMHLYTWWRVEGSDFFLVFCSTLAALVSVISVLCSRILRSLRGWVIMGTPWQFALNKTPPARPNIGFTICHLAFFFPLGRPAQGSSLLNPRASAPLSVGPTQSIVQGHPLATWVTSAPVCLAYPVCPENEICAAPIRICRHSGWSCWTCFTIVKDVL